LGDAQLTQALSTLESVEQVEIDKLHKLDVQIDKAEKQCVKELYLQSKSRIDQWLTATSAVTKEIESVPSAKVPGLSKNITALLNQGFEHLQELMPYSKSGVEGASDFYNVAEKQVKLLQRRKNWLYNQQTLRLVREVESNKDWTPEDKIRRLAEVSEELLSPYVLRRHNELLDKVFESLPDEDAKVRAVRLRILRVNEEETKGMTGKLLTICACLLLVAAPRLAQAKTFAVTASPFVEHPVHHPIQCRSGSVWRSRVGTWGENLAGETLRLRGFNEIHEIKNGSNNGIDRIAVKRGPSGGILDAKVVEVKTSRSARPKLGRTRYGGTRMSRKWLATNFSQMRNSGDPALKKLALELSRFRKASRLPVESFGEIAHVNTKTGTITGYSADGRAVKYSQSIEKLLKNVQAKAGTRQARNWATRTLSQWDQIRSSSMSNWLGKSVTQQSRKSVLANSGRGLAATRTAVLRQSRSAMATKVLQRSAGRIAIVVALAMDAKELFDTEYAYRTGAISVR
jgi:hypothetical protein